MSINVVKLRGIAEKYGMTIPELLRTIINEYNKPEDEKTVHIKKSEKISISELEKLYKEYQEKPKRSWELEKSKKQEIQEQSANIVQEETEEDKFFEFARKHTGNFSYLLKDREIVEALGKRGKFPKVSEEEIEQYLKLQQLIEKIDKQQGILEEDLIIETLRERKCNSTEIKILKARLETIRKEKASRELK